MGMKLSKRVIGFIIVGFALGYAAMLAIYFLLNRMYLSSGKFYLENNMNNFSQRGSIGDLFNGISGGIMSGLIGGLICGLTLFVIFSKSIRPNTNILRYLIWVWVIALICGFMLNTAISNALLDRHFYNLFIDVILWEFSLFFTSIIAGPATILIISEAIDRINMPSLFLFSILLIIGSLTAGMVQAFIVLPVSTLFSQFDPYYHSLPIAIIHQAANGLIIGAFMGAIYGLTLFWYIKNAHEYPELKIDSSTSE
jgi:hypothetical protein